MALRITYNAPIVKKVVFLVMLTFQLVCPVLADQAYGRFGRFHEDGLLTTNVHPRGFSVLGTNPELNIRWGDPKAALSAVVTSINPTEKILAVEGGGVGAPAASATHWYTPDLRQPLESSWSFGFQIVPASQCG